MSRIISMLRPLGHCDPLLPREGDLLVQAAGFEDRTMATVQTLVDNGTNKARAILLDYRPQNSRNRIVDVRDALASRGITVADRDILEYARFDPGDFESRLLNGLKRHGPKRIILDISTMSKLAIMLVLKVCYDLNVQVLVIYCEAEEYGPNREEFENAKRQKRIHQPSLQIFTGVHGVIRVDSLASVAMQGQPTAAIVFMSFNDALTQVLLNTVYPSRLLLINGRPPVHRWREEATAWIHEQVRREWESDNPLLESTTNKKPRLPKRVVSTLDYRETVDLVLRLYWQLSVDHRIVLAPAGSKLQAVGCFLAKALHPDIHIEYPSPEGFRPPYSRGIGTRWKVDLGRLSSRITELSNAERRDNLEVAT